MKYTQADLFAVRTIGRTAAKILSTTALTAAGIALFASPSKADNWGDHTYDEGHVDVSIPDVTNLHQTTDFVKARGDGDIIGTNITNSQTVNSNSHSWDDHTYDEGSVDVDTSTQNVTNLKQHTDFVKARGDGDIEKGHTVNIEQNNSNSKYVLYDIENDPVLIQGALNANGQVFIFDQDGTIFAEGSRVNVGSIVASTGSISDADLRDGDGRYTFQGVDTGGAIELKGTISVADAGLAAFVAPTVKNSGVINARLGKVAMAAGSRVTLDLYGDGLVEIAASDKVNEALLENSGTVNAEGGVVVMTARDAREVADNVINMSGVINASSATVKGGKIILGGNNGNVKVSGTLNASGTDGGKIDVRGKNIEVTETANIVNDGGENGQGGRSIVFADNLAIINGRLSAKGREDSGFIETSGSEMVYGEDASIITTGEWLIDPQNITIGNVLATLLEAQLLFGNATVTTSPFGFGAGDITVTGSIDWFTNNSLTLNAIRDINLNAGGAINSNGNGDFIANSGRNFNIYAGSGGIDMDGGDILINNGGIFFSAMADSLETLTGTITLNQHVGGSIQNAINAIDNHGSGLNTINVGPGTFTEQLVIRENNFLIRGNNAGDSPSNGVANPATIISAPASLPAFVNTYGTDNRSVVLVDGAQNVTLDGFVVDGNNVGNANYRMSGIGYFNASGAIKNTEVKNIGNNPFNGVQQGNGIHVSNVDGTARNVDIVSNYIHHFQKNGITFNEAGLNGNIVGNKIEGLGEVNFIAQNGIQIGFDANVTVSGNTISGIGYTPDGIYQGASILVYDAGNDVNLTNNTITGTGVDLGIALYFTDFAEIHDNTVNGSDVGIDVYASGNAKLTGNIINNTTHDGISVYSSANAQILNNEIGLLGALNSIGSGAGGGDAIFVTDSDGTIIQGNSTANTHYNGPLRKGSGILVTNSDNVQIGGAGALGNDIALAGSDGIVIRTDGGTANGNTIEGNTIHGAAGSRTGIYTENATNTTIKNNNVSGTGRYAAIYGNGGSNFSITGNTLNHNDEMGILVQNAGGTNLIDGNIIDNTGENPKASDGTNVGNGIHVENTSGLTVSNNQIGTHGGAIRGDGVFVSNANGVVIKGNAINDTRETTLDANGSNGSGIQVINTNGVTIGGAGADRNTITNAQWDGIRLEDNSNVVVNNNSIDNVTRVGIWGEKIQTALVTNNIVKNDHLAGYGSIHADLGSNWIVSNNDIDFGDYGIRLHNVGGAFNIIDNNDVDNVTHDGIYAHGSSGVTIVNNDIGKFGGNVGGNGIVNDNSHGAYLSQNEVYGAGLNGIYMFGTNNGVIQNNIVDGSGLDGIRTFNTFESLLIGGPSLGYANVVTNSGDDGIDVENAAGTVQVNHNKVDGTVLGYTGSDGHNGIEVSGTTGAKIIGNEVKNAGWDGINVQQASGTKIERNTITDTKGASGIGIVNGASNTLVDKNIVTRSQQYGMYIGGHSGPLDITNNTVSGVTQYDGIYVNNSATPNIDTNYIDAIGRDGISLLNISGNTDLNRAKVVNNLIGYGANKALNGGDDTTIGRDGIRIENSNYTNINKNKIAHTLGNGIFVDPSDYDVIAGNTINDVALNGIYSLNNSYVTIGGTANASDGNTITHVGQNGILVEGGTGNKVQRNVINDTGFAGNPLGQTGAGVFIKDSTFAEVYWNAIGAGAGLIRGDGIFVSNSDNAVIKRNTIKNTVSTGFDIGSGIQVSNSDNVTIGGANNTTERNTISDVQWDGIRVDYNSGTANNVTVENNLIDRVERVGIYTENVTNSTLLNNRITTTNRTDEAGSGIWVNGGNNVDVLGNRVNRTGNNGIYATSVSQLLIDGNLVGLTGGNANIKSDGIEVVSSNGAIVSDNEVSNTVGNGIYVRNSNDVEIGGAAAGNGNLITKAGIHGINVENGLSALIRFNRVEGGSTLLFSAPGVAGAQEDGIHVFNNQGVEIFDNTIQAGNRLGLNTAGLGANGNGIYVEGSDDAVISRNYVNPGLFTDSVGADGIHVTGSDNVLIGGADLTQANVITGTRDDGIDVSYGLGMEISNNIVTDVADDGVQAFGFLGLDINNNIISLSGDDGVDVDFAALVDISDNIITGGDDNGIETSRTALSQISGNTITGVANDAIRVEQALGAAILGNIITAAGDDGIYLDETMGTLIAGNIITSSGDDGIDINDSIGSLVALNAVTGSTDNGIEVEDSHYVAMLLNAVIGSGNAGIFVDPSSNILVALNLILGNKIGVHFDDVTDSLIVANLITDNETGIQLEDSSNIGILYNTINNSTAQGFYAAGAANGLITLAGNTFNDNTTGLRFESGIIDLTGDTNFINGGTTGMLFDGLYGIGALQLVAGPSDTPGTNGTFGTTTFTGQSGDYITLTNNAFSLGANNPIWLDVTYSTFDGFTPDSKPRNGAGIPILTLAEFNALESKFTHFNDSNLLGLLLFGQVPGIAQEDLFKYFQFGNLGASGLNITVLGFPRVPGGPAALNSIQTFAGGNSPADLNNIQTAAGGEDTATPFDLNAIETAAGGTEQVACWGDAMNVALSGKAVSYSYSGDMEATLGAAAGCSTTF